MYGFCGYVDFANRITNDKIILEMIQQIGKKEQHTHHEIIHDHSAISYTKQKMSEENLQPFSKTYFNNEYIIVYHGKLYNVKEIQESLLSKGHEIQTKNEAELILDAYLEYGKKCVNYFNGIFSFAIYDINNDTIFLARDRLGVKPLFYVLTDQYFIFSSEIKAILAHPDMRAILDKTGLMELIGLGPAHTPGKTYFKNIFELQAGEMALLKNQQLQKEIYWDLTTKECMDDEKEAITQIHDLVVDATQKQLVSDVGISSMLSGGLDSSILAKIAKDNIPNLITYSIDYVGNDQNFAANDYQLTKDSDYVKIMKDYLKSDHHTLMIENTLLFDLLDDAMIARDMPGMADIDSSMYAFCHQIAKDGCQVCLSGECSDEIFGGYPWYYKEHLINHEGFPWALSENLRDRILKKDILQKGELREYIDQSRKNTLAKVQHLDTEDQYERRFRNINYLTIKWFMNTLIERTERVSMATGLEVRVPFADYRIFEYVYNLPAKMKLGLSKASLPVEKYLLRKAFENELPEDVVYRKKSPFPKTYDPVYLKLVETRMQEILQNKDSKLSQIINFDFVHDMLTIHGENLTENWFGQLMTYPQTLAFLIQIDKWLDVYHIELEI